MATTDGDQGDEARQGGPDPAADTYADGYPVEWEADVVLRDGTTTHVRPIRPSDADALQRFHMAQSERSTYLRFFAPMERLSERDLRRFTVVDHIDRVALVAVAQVPDGDRLREDIIGVARFDRTAPHEAEVAFNVSDRRQGQGLGSVLLEHVAAAARERDIERFTADVLPQNGKMLAVFREAGYELKQRVDDGVVLVSVDLDPTERSRAVMAERERRAEARSMQAVLGPRRVLLYVEPGAPVDSVERVAAERILAGALVDPGDVTFDVVGLDGPPPGSSAVVDAGRVRFHTGLAALAAAGPAPVPPRPGPDGATGAAASGPADGPEEWRPGTSTDLAVLSTLPQTALDVVPELARLGARALVVVSGGFAEIGEQGFELQRELVRRAHTLGMRVVGPASYGLLRTVPGERVNVLVAPITPRPGPVGMFCQSAPSAVTLIATLTRRRLGVSTFVSAGNRADVSGNDVMQLWSDDPATTVACLYLESIGNPRKFSRIARRLASTKPVVVVATGSSQAAPPGHAVRRAQVPRRALDEMLEQSGVIHAANTHQMADVAQLLAHQPLPAGARVGVVGSAPALTAAVADAARAQGLQVAVMASVPREDAPREEIDRSIDEVYAPGACDVVVAVHVPTLRDDLEWLAQEITVRAGQTGRTTIVAALGFHGLTRAFTATLPDGRVVQVPACSTPEDAVWAVGAAVRYAQWRARDHGEVRVPAGLDRDAARALVEAAGDGPLDDAQVAGLLGCYGVPVLGARHVRTADEAALAAAQIGYPVALKVRNPALRGRADLGGVRLDIHGEAELRASYRALVTLLEDRFAGVGSGAGTDAQDEPPFEVQAMAPPGVACSVRAVEDPSYGPVLAFGLAGDAVDLLDDVAYGVPPLTDADLGAMVRRVRAAPRLFGYRGAPPVDVAALEDLLARVAALKDDLPEVAHLELDPVVVGPAGYAVLVATAGVARATRRSDALRRALSVPTGPSS